MYAYAHATIDDDTFKLTGISSSVKLFDFIRRYKGPKGLPIFFTQKTSTFLINRIQKNVR